MANNPQDPKKPEKAVALGYDMGLDPAPKILAKGEGSIAEQIIKLAEEHRIPIRKDADLVEILSVLELDSFIPLEAYTAVAEILRYIYQQNAATTSSK
jgi:flagellar biosynthesis protein